MLLITALLLPGQVSIKPNAKQTYSTEIEKVETPTREIVSKIFGWLTFWFVDNSGVSIFRFDWM